MVQATRTLRLRSVRGALFGGMPLTEEQHDKGSMFGCALLAASWPSRSSSPSVSSSEWTSSVRASSPGSPIGRAGSSPACSPLLAPVVGGLGPLAGSEDDA
eukprot:12945775-Heterocapsa_arctica.AAC.1